MSADDPNSRFDVDIGEQEPSLHEPGTSFKEGYFMLFHNSGSLRRITLEAQVRQFLLFPSDIYIDTTLLKTLVRMRKFRPLPLITTNHRESVPHNFLL